MSWEKHAHDYFEVISFYNSKIYNILQYVISWLHMCNLHIKETEISQKRSKGIKNWKITYSVILNVLSNKTNLILGFTFPLKIAIDLPIFASYYALLCICYCFSHLIGLFSVTWLYLLYKFSRFFIYFLFLSDEGPTLETLDHTIRIGSTPTFLYFDLYA